MALASVLESAAREAVQMLCLTGDFVGYYYDPARVIQMLEDWRFHAVRGNHEDILFDVLENSGLAPGCRRKYGSGIDHAIRNLEAPELGFLAELPRSLQFDLDGKSILLAHGAPWETDVYVYPDSDEKLWARVASYDADYIVLGHTHYQHARQIAGKLVINPGSVGQPRDRKPGAAWAILETETGALEFRVEAYDSAALVAQAQKNDPDLPYLWTVLTRR